MSPHVETAIALVKTLTLIFGGLISYRSYQAYQRTGAEPLRALAIGFAIVTLGAALAGFVDLMLPLGIGTSVLLSSTLTLIGFAVITYSLYME